jgi:hypothetical protein
MCGYVETFNDDCPLNRCPKCDIVRFKLTYYKGQLDKWKHSQSERWSKAMGCLPNEIEQRQKDFPGSEYHPETGDLKIRGWAHDKYEAKRRGLIHKS